MYKSKPRKSHKLTSRGFTLIELLVVISIIGLLSSVVLAALNTARNKAYDAHRFSDLNQIDIALQNYYADNGSYPSTSGHYYSYCGGTPFNLNNPASQGAAPVIPNSFTPTYIATIPVGPKQVYSSALPAVDCYAYISNGSDFKFVDFNPETAGGKTPNPSSAFDDPGDSNNAWAVWSSYTYAVDN
jgi:prepilin-type N-terminal cleavage/methylation domain-containing protein